jgi:hypothetical protein
MPSIMRRGRFRAWVGDVQAAAYLLFHLLQFARQQVDLPPLGGDGGVELLDGLVLERDARFKGLEAVGKVLELAHGRGDRPAPAFPQAVRPLGRRNSWASPVVA